MTREEHLDWCKQRAHEYLKQGDVSNAVASMMSDLNKHDELKAVAQSTAMIGMFAVTSGNIDEARRYIDGFN